MARPDKAAAVAELADEFRSSNAAVLTDYRGLSVAELQELRRSLGESAKYAVVKNTLTKIAVKDAGVEELTELLVGPSAIAFVKGDPVEAAKGLRDFARAHPFLVIKGGVLDGRPLSADEISKLADLESREVLLARLAGAMKAGPQQAASLFVAPLSQMARLVEALRQKVEQEGGPADTTDTTDGTGGTDSSASAADTEASASTEGADGAEASASTEGADGAEASASTEGADGAEASATTEGADGTETTVGTESTADTDSPDTTDAPTAEAANPASDAETSGSSEA
jgi:large subunit ribosomal protein L10